MCEDVEYGLFLKIKVQYWRYALNKYENSLFQFHSIVLTNNQTKMTLGEQRIIWLIFLAQGPLLVISGEFKAVLLAILGSINSNSGTHSQGSKGESTEECFLVTCMQIQSQLLFLHSTGAGPLSQEKCCPQWAGPDPSASINNHNREAPLHIPTG